MRRAIRAGLFALVVLILSAGLSPGDALHRAVAAQTASPLGPAAPVAALLMDVRTGRVLYAREIHRRWPPASTTKILTAIVVLERLPLDSTVTVTPRAAAMRSGSAIGLQAGEQWTVRDLLHVMLLHSANDAAVALAEASAWSVARFAARMNAKARQIGARESHFTNPNGLHDPRHYTTASDLAIIARTGLRVPALAAIVRTKVWEMDRPGRAGEVYVNRNKLLTRYEGADGVKTGFTAASGHVLVASATRNDWQLLSVVLKSADPYADTEQLLNFGFATFAPVVLARRGAVLATVTIGTRHARLSAVVPSDVHAVVRRGASVASRVALRPGLQPPIPAGAQVGEVRFVEGQSVVAKSVLIAGEPVGR